MEMQFGRKISFLVTQAPRLMLATLTVATSVALSLEARAQEAQALPSARVGTPDVSVRPGEGGPQVRLPEYGQCTWYAMTRFNEVAPTPKFNWWGHAKDYRVQADAAGWRTSRAASDVRVSSIIVWRGGDYGHVGWVEARNGNAITVREMNWVGLAKISVVKLNLNTLNRRGRSFTYVFDGFVFPERKDALAPAPTAPVSTPEVDPDIGRGASNRQPYLDAFGRGGGRGPVGSPVNDAHAWNGIMIQDFRAGSLGDGAIIEWDGKAYWIHGGIWQKYGPEMQGAASPLGRPTSDEEGLSRSQFGTQGRYNRFENGTLVWSAEYGPHPVYGLIRQKWLETGGVGGPHGYPTSDILQSGTMFYQWFERGWVAYNSENIGYDGFRVAQSKDTDERQKAGWLSSVRLSTAQADAARATITLRFTGPLQPLAAGNAGAYALWIDGQAVKPERATLLPNSTVALAFESQSFDAGEELAVQWSLRDERLLIVRGSAKVMAR